MYPICALQIPGRVQFLLLFAEIVPIIVLSELPKFEKRGSQNVRKTF